MSQLYFGSRLSICLVLILALVLVSCIPYIPQGEAPATAEQSQSPPGPDESASTPQDHPPVIHNMQAQQEVAPSGSLEISCIASDIDGDELFYSWSTETGNLKGKGESITWTAPGKPGEYTISVTVSDGNGMETLGSVSVTVAPIINQYPTVSLVLTPKGEEPINVLSSSEVITVRQWTVMEIECIATDPDGDELTYEWSVTDGNIDGEGSKASYIARGPGDHFITVAVTDSTGRKSLGNIRLHVKCCGSK